MKEFDIHYTYAKMDGTSRTQTSQKVKADTEREAKAIIESKHASKGQKVVQWR